MGVTLFSRQVILDALRAGRDIGDGQIHKAFVCDDIKQAKSDSGRSRQFVISTGSVDRDNDTINPAGWHLDNYRRCPTVLFAHDYSSFPVARCTDVHIEDGKLVATAEFAKHEMAQTVLELIDGGFLVGTSVGFRPMRAEPSGDRDGLDFQEQELLEFSIVPVPANPDALIIARSKGINIEPLQAWARKTLAWTIAATTVDKGVSPKDVSLTKAPEGEAWSAPSLGDLLSGSWDDAADAQKRKVAGHFAWAAKVPPDTFGDCKLPHHNTSGAIVIRGVSAAAGRMNQASIPSGDMGAVKAHLKRHYVAFGKTPPWESNATAWAEYEKFSGTLVERVAELTRLGFADEADALQATAATPSAKLRRAVAKQEAGAVLTALLTALDDHIDAADDIADAVLASLGIPDDDEMSEPEGDALSPPVQPGMGGAGLPLRSVQRDAGIGDTLTGPANVPVPGTATSLPCPACGATYDGKVCLACGWRSPDALPMNALVEQSAEERRVKSQQLFEMMKSDEGFQQSRASALKMLAEPKQAKGGYSITARPTEDPISWNRHLSKAFDVAIEPLDPSGVEIAWVSRYLDTPVQHISVENFTVPSARMGSFLAALEEGLIAWTVDAVRSITYSGHEVPPENESIQLNSLTTRGFLVEGIRFMRRQDGAKIVSKLRRTWLGLDVTHYVKYEQAKVRTVWVNRIRQRASELNYLKGEAFTLSGEFLDRGDLDWKDLFLPPAQEAVIRRSVDRINEQGEDLESRGLLLMGAPGTGKTLSGRVMLRQADTTFIWISARDFYRSGAFGAFTYAFDLAAECAPTILFFEDVDNWLGPDTIDLLKTEMDGLKRRKGVLTVLTTNFPELLPEALIDRPGRFHDLLEMALPTEAVRARMLASWLPEAPEKTRHETAKQTDGFSGAHLRELANFAGTIQREQSVGLDEALPLALEKIREQRALVASLHEAPDYRPRRQVRMLVAQALGMVAKRGRVLSAANEGKLRAAQEHLGTAGEHMASVLSQLDKQPPPADEDGGKALALQLDEASILILDDEDILTLDPDDEEFNISAEDITAALQGVLRESVSLLVAEQTQVALDRARGRVD